MNTALCDESGMQHKEETKRPESWKGDIHAEVEKWRQVVKVYNSRKPQINMDNYEQQLSVKLHSIPAYVVLIWLLLIQKFGLRKWREKWQNRQEMRLKPIKNKSLSVGSYGPDQLQPLWWMPHAGEEMWKSLQRKKEGRQPHE